MNSRERILNAIRRQPVDHVPLYLRLWSMGTGQDNIPFAWRDQVVRAESLLRLGVDDTLLLQPPLGYTEDYDADQADGIVPRVRRIEPDTPGDYATLVKEYDTPDGTLTQSVKISEDWQHGNNIMLFSDFNVARYVEPPVKRLEDLRRLRHLLAQPTPAQLEEFRQRAARLRGEAQRLGVALDGGWCALGDSAVWLSGMQNVLFWQMDEPRLLEALLDALLEWELMRLDLVLNEGVDAVVHMAWYEGTDFWTPKNYRRMLKPRLKQIIDKVHSRGALFRYIITKGWQPLRQDLLDLGVDCITGVDPVQDKLDLQEVKETIGSRICLMGGVNSAVMLTQWRDDEIRRAIDQAMDILSPGSGFILWPVDNVFCELPWEKVLTVIDHWKTHW